MFRGNKSLLVVTLVAVVNSLGYGIIIPILYPYSQRFGMSDFQNGLLFSIFSVCQFVATPLIGRLSDKYGRRPLLIISLIGTCLSFVLMALAQSSMWLFLARALDGITAGNFPVAQAVISDTTAAKDRARGFGIMGAAFGFGFVFGPAISALTVGFGMQTPFWIAAAVTLVAVVLTMVLLPETNKHLGAVRTGKLFDLKHLVEALYDPRVGKTLILSLLYSLAFSLLIYAYQPFAVKVLHMNPQMIAINFTLFGLMGLVAQVVVMGRVVKMWGEQKALSRSLLVVMLVFVGYFLVRNQWHFFGLGIFLGLANSLVNPLIQAVLSKETDAASQGSIMGVNASYMGIGMIVGPVIGGIVATLGVPLPFIVGAMVVAVCWYLAGQIKISGEKVVAF